MSRSNSARAPKMWKTSWPVAWSLLLRNRRLQSLLLRFGSKTVDFARFRLSVCPDDSYHWHTAKQNRLAERFRAWWARRIWWCQDCRLAASGLSDPWRWSEVSTSVPIRRSSSWCSGPRPSWTRNSPMLVLDERPPDGTLGSCRTNTRPKPTSRTRYHRSR